MKTICKEGEPQLEKEIDVLIGLAKRIFLQGYPNYGAMTLNMEKNMVHEAIEEVQDMTIYLQMELEKIKERLNEEEKTCNCSNKQKLVQQGEDYCI